MKRFLSVALVLILLISCLAGCEKPVDTSNVTVDPNGLSLEEYGITYESLAQKAVVKTAIAYWQRGSRAQYDDTRLNVSKAPTFDKTLYRWQSGVRLSPEAYTTQYPGYLNCAAFVHDVYLAALNLDIVANYTGHLAAIDDASRVYQYVPTGNETAEEKAQVEKTFYETLKIGDIVVAYSGGGGHTIVYVGNQIINAVEGTSDENSIYDSIHSTGTNYIYESITEQYESTGTVGKTSTHHWFNESNSRYVFKLKSLTILRPLNIFTQDVPENSMNRLQYMDNIVAEKLSSHPAGTTAGPKQEISYTFSITNNRTSEVTLQVKDTIPENTAFVSSENCHKSGNDLTWIVTVPAGETATVSYTVKVNKNAKAGSKIESTAGTVGGVAVNCPGIYVGTTLSAEQRTALLAAIDTYATSDLRGMELANAIYKDVLKTDKLLPEDSTTVLNKLFRADGDYFYLESEKNAYTNAIAPGLFGGRYVPQRDATTTPEDSFRRYENDRTRWINQEQLMVGDIIIAAQNATASRQRLYLYTGEKMLDLNSGDEFFYVEMDVCLTPMISYNRFVVLRPSLILDNQ